MTPARWRWSWRWFRWEPRVLPEDAMFAFRMETFGPMGPPGRW